MFLVRCVSGGGPLAFDIYTNFSVMTNRTSTQRMVSQSPHPSRQNLQSIVRNGEKSLNAQLEALHRDKWHWKFDQEKIKEHVSQMVYQYTIQK